VICLRERRLVRNYCSSVVFVWLNIFLEREKRLKWIKQNRHKLKIIKGSDVEKAYKLFYLEYLNVKEKEIEIVEKSEKRIVLRSYNFCPVLEACKKLNLDTRIICKKNYMKNLHRFLFNKLIQI